MAQYGLTPNGPNIKRLDVIVEQIHSKLTERLGVNTRQNPQSLLNHLLTNVADQIAELWELGADVYYSQYVSSAEGSDLDNAIQYGAITREMPAKSYYPILCTGIDGTVIPAGTTIASDTNPATNLTNAADGVISRSACSKATIALASENPTSALSVVINNNLFAGLTMEELASSIKVDGFTVSLHDNKILLSAVDESSSNSLVLSENLTTETVSSVVTFGTEENGDICIPNGVITKIVKSVAGLKSVSNVGAYIAGRLTESDAKVRQSYVDKIYNRSRTMCESVRSDILQHVQGVKTVAVYENDTDKVDEMGRAPHCIEVVVEGGDKSEIAQRILASKAGGISTWCSDESGESVEVKGEYGEDITIRFNRPTKVYIWFQIGVTLSSVTTPPTNYAERIKEIILECMEEVEAGTDVLPQRFIERLSKEISGIDYYDIRLFSTDSESASPTEFKERSVNIKPRERAVTSESRIGVVIDG